MPFSPGTRLGPYSILSPLGAGGFGDVYKARDTRLDRTVAIKILRADVATNPQRQERFRREARAISSLTHPHICTLHDVGQQDGVDFLVMEYLGGETLAHRLLRGALSIEEVLRIAIQLADALNEAHRAGLTHRDLKPANVMLTASGAKVLDFGLAKWRDTDSDAGFSAVVTAHATVTQVGALVGTVQYMAPEQLEGKDADARTDIFALGAVMYEMTTAKKAFTGDSQAGLIAAILDATPPAISTLQPLTPPALDHVVTTCLAKDPDQRWQTAGDLKRNLKWISDIGLHVGRAVPTPVRPKRSQHLAAIALGLLVGATTAGIVASRVPRPSVSTPRPIVYSVVPFPPGKSVQEIGVPIVMAISPDGMRLVFSAGNGGQSQLYVRGLDQRTATPIPGTENASDPFFSPDGQWVGFETNVSDTHSVLKKVPLGSGAAPTTVCDLTGPVYGASWGPDNMIVFNAGNAAGLSRVSAAGGTPEVLTIPDRGRREKTHRWPDILPDGKTVIFTVGTADIASYDEARIEVLSLETGTRRTLIDRGTFARYVPTGHLTYARAGALFAVPFDPGRSVTAGTPVQILDDVATEPEIGGAHVAFSKAGSLVYVAGQPRRFFSNEGTLMWVNRQGEARRVTDRSYPFFSPRLSPDGHRLAVGVGRSNDEIWIDTFERDAMSRLVFGWNNGSPVWTADGTRLVFASERTGVFNIFWQPADGSGPAERVLTSAHNQWPYSCSPDGKMLAFVDSDPVTREDIWTVPLEGDRKPRPFLREPFSETRPSFSPDGRWLAYESDESGRSEIYVRPYPGPGGKWQISNDGGSSPVWARNGNELFYSNADGKLRVVKVTLGASFTATKPQPLDQIVASDARWSNYDVSPDGERFVVVSEVPEAPKTQINLVLNWFTELQQRVPTR